METVKFYQGNVITKLPIEEVEISNESKELFDYKKKSAIVNELKKTIETNGIYSPLFVFKKGTKYTIVDGVLRYLALKSLNFNEVDCVILDIKPTCSNGLKDLIIRYNIKSTPTTSEKIKMYAHLLRLDDDSKHNKTFEEGAELISAINGKGWKRNNSYNFKKIYLWDKQSPNNNLDLVEKVVTGEISFDKAKTIIEILTDPSYNYDIVKEKEIQILQKYSKGLINKSKALSLINQYNFKKNDGLTRLLPTEKLSTEKYKVIYGDSKQATFPDDTSIDLIFTSPPYYKLINYGKLDEENREYEIGNEPTVDEFCKNLTMVFLNGSRYLKDTGVIAVNLDSTYDKFRNLKVMESFVSVMEDAGFIYIDEVIWLKSNAKPYNNTVKRFGHSYEKILLFAKTEKYYYQKLRLYDENKKSKINRNCREQGNKGLDFTHDGYHISNPYRSISNFLKENEFLDIIDIHTSHERPQDKGLQNGFFGSFPTLLPVPFILSFSPENGTVWDPFGGTGTTGLGALLLGRNVIISELYEKNVVKISETLQRGVDEFNAEYFKEVTDDFLNSESYGDAA